MSISGDSVKLTATFKNFAGTLTDPDSVVLSIYDSDKTTVLSGPHTLDAATYKVSTGVWEYIYALPDKKRVYYEFIGTLDGYPAAARGEIDIRWVE